MGSTGDVINRRVEVTGVAGNFQIVETPANTVPPPNGFILKTHYAGICHTDSYVWKNQIKISDDLVIGMDALVPGFSFPFVLGHEFSGEIYALGSEYKGEKKVGERVVVYPWQGCEQCNSCKRNESTECAANIAFTYGIGKDGGYQAYVSIPDVKYAVSIPDRVTSQVACLFGCSSLTAYNSIVEIQRAVERACQNNGSGKLLVIGAGGVGLWTVLWAKALLPKTTKVVIANTSEPKLKLAKKLGADETILWPREASDEELIGKTKEVLGGGFDACVDNVGIPSTVNKAFQCANKRGHIGIVGIVGGLATIPIFAMVANMVTVSGVYTGSLEQMKNMVKTYQDKKMDCPPMTVVKPEEAEAALTDLCAGKVIGRAVIDFTDNNNN